MIAIAESATCRELKRVLTEAGWSVRAARDPAHALRLCRSIDVDVLLVADTVPGGPLDFMDRLKGDGELFNTAVVFVGAGLDVDGVVSAMNRGAADVLRTPVDAADAVARATSAARTKALVKELIQHNQRIEGLVLLDELTGLRSRRAVRHDLELLVATARRHQRPLAAIMVDVDHFKPINDVHGHRVGDEVLREVARRMEQRLRGPDVAGRLGGDELLVLLPETDADGAATLAQCIHDAIGDRPVDTDVGPIGVTVSVGSAAWAGDTGDELVERADRAMYAAKGAGRDRTVAL